MWQVPGSVWGLGLWGVWVCGCGTRASGVRLAVHFISLSSSEREHRTCSTHENSRGFIESSKRLLVSQDNPHAKIDLQMWHPIEDPSQLGSRATFEGQESNNYRIRRNTKARSLGTPLRGTWFSPLGPSAPSRPDASPLLRMFTTGRLYQDLRSCHPVTQIPNLEHEKPKN